MPSHPPKAPRTLLFLARLFILASYATLTISFCVRLNRPHCFLLACHRGGAIIPSSCPVVASKGFGNCGRTTLQHRKGD